jgi:ubiquinone/menaquinone biosynthesis C-methylase UbiE
MGHAGDTSYLDFSADLGDAAAVSAYDQAPLWSAMFGLLLLEHVPLRAGARILDVGCGTGFPLLELTQRGGPASIAVGVDLWREALARAGQKRRTLGLRNVALVHGDAAAMPFADAAFELIVSNLGINNFADPGAAFAECSRLLAPVGTLALTTNLRGHMREFYAVFEQTLLELKQDDAVESLRAHVDHRVTIDGVKAMLGAAGLAVTRVEEASRTMRFADGTALLHAYFIKLGFLDAWKAVVAPERREETFVRLEGKLNDAAAAAGALELTIPMAYMEARRSE